MTAAERRDGGDPAPSRADWRACLAARGHVAFPRGWEFAPSLNEVVAALEPTRRRCSRLAARPADRARPNTLSSRYGLAALPLHTDDAATAEPPRYILLAAPSWRTAPTTVLDLGPLIGRLELEGRRSLFRVDAGRSRHLQRFLDVRGRGWLMRFNDDVMEPVEEAARAVRRSIGDLHHEAIEVSWANTRLLVLDNWRVLHGRGAVKCSRRSCIRRLAIWTGR